MGNQQTIQGEGARKPNRLLRRILLIELLFVGIGALGGGGAALISPDGSLMQAQTLIPALQDLPLVGPLIDSLLLPASALLLFVFVPQTLAAIFLLRKRPRQYTAGIVAGILLMLFTLVELIFLFNVLSIIYFALGASEVALSYLCGSAFRAGSSQGSA
ncbi:MAG: hypothetical protein FWF91_06740 [Coriobacteriia bacterium]|nr:hypothetical protein [Coriobacteriia bacterium]